MAKKIVPKSVLNKPEEPLKILINDSLKEELKIHRRKIKELEMRTALLITGYLMALGHEGHNCTIDANYSFLTLIKKEKTNGEGN